MNELLEVLQRSYKAFYIGEDSEAWEYFSQAIGIMQLSLTDSNLDINFQREILAFIGKFDQIEQLKLQMNYTIIADIICNAEKSLSKFKEFN